jgi:hypothetical protein
MNFTTEGCDADKQCVIDAYNHAHDLIMEWNKKHPGERKWIQVRDNKYVSKRIPNKSKKPRKIKPRKGKNIMVDCSKGCGSRCQVKPSEYVETEQYMCKHCDVNYRRTYGRQYYKKRKNREVEDVIEEVIEESKTEK